MEVPTERLIQIIGDKQVRLDLMTEYAGGLEREVARLRGVVDQQAEQIEALQNPPEEGQPEAPILHPQNAEDVEAARMEARE